MDEEEEEGDGEKTCRGEELLQSNSAAWQPASLLSAFTGNFSSLWISTWMHASVLNWISMLTFVTNPINDTNGGDIPSETFSGVSWGTTWHILIILNLPVYSYFTLGTRSLWAYYYCTLLSCFTKFSLYKWIHKR